MTHRAMSEHFYHGATSRSVQLEMNIHDGYNSVKNYN